MTEHPELKYGRAMGGHLQHLVRGMPGRYTPLCKRKPKRWAGIFNQRQVRLRLCDDCQAIAGQP